MNKRPSLSLSRRSFVRSAGAAAALWTIVPRHVVAGAGVTSPNERLNIAAIGVGGMGAADIQAITKAGQDNIVALCDVDGRRAADTMKKYPNARVFRDFRRMFDVMEREIDAVIVATPDHTHAVAAMAAMIRGKHVYCEKPLAHSIHEIRQMARAAREHKVVTQMGNQGHSSDSIRRFCEWIWDGAIGNVHTIHAGCAGINSALDQLPLPKYETPIDSELDWHLWLGPAQHRPYHPAYLPGSWRSWMPFGCGTIGDWVCHVIDPVFWALDLGIPTRVRAEAKDYDPKKHGDTFPRGEKITYDFPATPKRGPITLHWYTGTEKIPRPPELEPDQKSVETGAVVVGDKGTILYGSHGAGGVRLIPQARMKAYTEPAKTIPRVAGHHADWLQAIRQGTQAGSSFAYGGPLTEIGLLGVIAIRMAGTSLDWGAEQMRFTNSLEANQYVNPPYRAGWSL